MHGLSIASHVQEIMLYLRDETYHGLDGICDLS